MPCYIMRMDRRGFLKCFGGLMAAKAVERTYFLPPIGGWKSDVIINPAYEIDAVTLEKFMLSTAQAIFYGPNPLWNKMRRYPNRIGFEFGSIAYGEVIRQPSENV